MNQRSNIDERLFKLQSFQTHTNLIFSIIKSDEILPKNGLTQNYKLIQSLFDIEYCLFAFRFQYDILQLNADWSCFELKDNIFI